ncbi:MAG: SelL-related redox protein [Fimbriimonadaceae bacterium]
MQAPEMVVTLDDGSRTPLGTLYRDVPLALVFLRHLGCVFCREQVAMLRGATDLNLVFVTMSSAGEAADFRERLYAPQRFIADPDGALYGYFGLERGGISQLASPRVMLRGAAATLAGHGFSRPPTDPRQLPGAVIIDSTGEIAWIHRAKDAADNVTETVLRAQLNSRHRVRP